MRRLSDLRLASIVVLVISGAVLAIHSGAELRYLDERTYVGLAERLLDHGAYVGPDLVSTASRPPGWPLVLAGTFLLDRNPLLPKLLNVLALAGAVLLLMRFTSREEPRAAPLVGWLAVCFPLFAYAASTLYPQILGSLGLVAAVGLAARPTPRSAVGAGPLFGALALLVPSFALLVPVLVAWIAWSARRAAPAAAFALAFVLVVAPWTARNAVRLGAFVPISTNGGLNLLMGNSAQTSPTAGVNIERSEFQKPPGVDEVGLDRVFRDRAVAWITSNPGDAFVLYLGKVANHFNFRNELATSAEASPWKDWLMAATYLPLLAVALVRIPLWRRIPPGPFEALCHVIYFSNAFASAVFFTRIRFRIPFDLLLVAMVASFLPKALDAWRARVARGDPDVLGAGR